MHKHLSEAPQIQLSSKDLMSSQGQALLARQAEEFGPVLRWIIPFGEHTGREVVFLVGPEANRFVLHTHRELFSHEKGWTPIVGHLIGEGLINMDAPEHTWHRKLWNPAFANVYMERYLPLMQRVIAEHTAHWAEQGEVDLYREARELPFTWLRRRWLALNITRGWNASRSCSIRSLPKGSAPIHKALLSVCRKPFRHVTN